MKPLTMSNFFAYFTNTIGLAPQYLKMRELYLHVPLRFLPTILLAAVASTAAWGLGRGPWGLGLGTGIGPVVEDTLRGGLGVRAGDSLWGPMAASALWMGTWGSDIYR